MKLSNKLLIGFFGGAFVYMLLAFTEVRLRGDDRRIDGGNTQIEFVNLQNVRYANFQDMDTRVNISTSDDPRIELKSRDGNILPGLSYESVGDTLTIQNLKKEENVRCTLTLFVSPEEFTGFTMNAGMARITDFESQDLSINQIGGHLTLNEEVYLENLTLKATRDAVFNAFSGRIDTLKLDLNSTDMTLRSKVRRLEGRMADGSSLFAGDINDIEFKKDKSSSIRLFD